MDSSRERDKSIERLLRQSRDTSQQAVITDSCLDAETLAALIAGGLSDPTLNAAQSHLADCARCQSLVGALARIDSVAPPAEPGHARYRWLGWIVPLAAAAAAVAVWVAVPNRRGAPLPQATEIQRPAAEPSAPQPTARAGRLEAPASANKAEPPPSIVPGDAAKKELDLASQSRQDAGRSAAGSLNAQSASSDAIASSASETPAPAAPAASAPPPPSANMLEAARSGARRAEAAGIEIISPDPAVRWRIARSTVQRSTDGGAAWETQSTGNAAELTAGAAPSVSVCWIVGRGGVVLLSIDGRNWRRVPFPETTDLSAVLARDARRASVSTADGRTFSTTDAGDTWVPRPLQDF